MAHTVNIFTQLGLDFAHRGKPFQEVRHREEVTVEKHRNGFPFIVDIKYDGNFVGVLVKDGKPTAYSRTGLPFTNLDGLVNKVKKYKKDGIYIGEVYCNERKLSLEKFQALHGPSRKAALSAPMTKLLDEDGRIAFFDYITIEEFIEGRSETPCEQRKGKLAKYLKLNKKSPNILLAESYVCANEKELAKCFKAAVKNGEEGIVIKGPDNPYVCGHKNFHFMKQVKGVAYDLTCVGVEEGTGKFEGLVGKLLFTYQNGETIGAGPGKGWTHEDLALMLKESKPAKLKKDKKAKKGKKDKKAVGTVGPNCPVGKVFKVTALEQSSKGALRLPKFQEIRHDTEADFS